MSYCKLQVLYVTLFTLARAGLANGATLGGAVNGNPQMVMDSFCKVMLKPIPATHLPAGGADAIAQRITLLADFPGIAPANVVLGAAAPGTLTVDTYAAALYGADFTARYNDAAAGGTWSFPPPGPSYRWIQEINTNAPLGGAGSPYIDPRPNDDPGGLPLPYYWTDPEVAGRTNGANGFGAFDLRFSDGSRRACGNRHITWCADLFIVDENRFTVPGADPLHVITIHDGVRWGFEIWPKQIGRRDLDLSDIIESFLEIHWTPADWNSDLFPTTFLGPTFPGGATTLPAQPPINDVLQIPDVWPPVNSPPDSIQFGADFIHPVTLQPATVQVEIIQLELVAVAPIQVPVIFDQSGLLNDLRVKIDLSKDSILITPLQQVPTTDRNILLNDVLVQGKFSTFDPAIHGLGVAGFRTFDKGMLFIPHPRGDMNGDMLVDALDVQIFVDTLLNPAPDINLLPFGDFTQDDNVTTADIGGMVQALLNFTGP